MESLTGDQVRSRPVPVAQVEEEVATPVSFLPVWRITPPYGVEIGHTPVKDPVSQEEAPIGVGASRDLWLVLLPRFGFRHCETRTERCERDEASIWQVVTPLGGPTLQIVPWIEEPDHAEIRIEAEAITLTDQGSTNGTYVNDSKIAAKQPHILKPGDEVRFGDRSFVLETK